MLSPTGFWSYTSSDDKHSGGKLSQLRALIAGELQQQIGRRPIVNIFQDVAAIPPGAAWERQIKDALDQTYFFIPILTPAFLQSEWCCRELELFRAREAFLDSDSLIFPLHFIDISHLDKSSDHDFHDATLYDLLKTRQWIDFHSLRHRSFLSEEVSVILESLAKAIRVALRQRRLPRPAPIRPTPPEDLGADDDDRHHAPSGPDRPSMGDTTNFGAEIERVAYLGAAALRDRDQETLEDEALRGHAIVRAKPPTDGGGGEISADDRNAVARYRRLRKAAEQGKAAAQNDLGVCYLNGSGIAKKNESEAVAWFRKAAEQGNADAQHNLGHCYRDGSGVPKKESEAIMWYRKAAEQGNPDAQNDLGVRHLNGWGIAKNAREAVAWFHKAAEQGSAEAQNNLGACYFNGLGLAKNEGDAVALFRKAAEQKDVIAQYNLGLCYHDGSGVSQNEAEAVAWLRRAADQGDPAAQNNLGVRYLRGWGVPKNEREGVAWFRNAAEHGVPDAQHNLGLCYLNGSGVAKNKGEAKAWFDRAAQQRKVKKPADLRRRNLPLWSIRPW